MPASNVTPLELATALAANLIHDAIGPAGGIVSAFDLAAEPGAVAMRDEALALAEESARNLLGLLTLLRSIYAPGEPLAPEAFGAVAKSLFAGSRATLDVSLDPGDVSAVNVRLALGLLRIATAATALGGRVSASLARDGGRSNFEVKLEGPKVKLPLEVLEGLASRAITTGTLHRWSAAYFLGSLARLHGGDINVRLDEGVGVIHVSIYTEEA